jgi:hypothetical protein
MQARALLSTSENYTSLPKERQDDLRRTVTTPLCNWLKRFKKEELCYMTDNVAVLNSKVIGSCEPAALPPGHLDS